MQIVGGGKHGFSEEADFDKEGGNGLMPENTPSMGGRRLQEGLPLAPGMDVADQKAFFGVGSRGVGSTEMLARGRESETHFI